MLKIDTLDPEFRKKVDIFLATLSERNYEVSVTDARRTMATQKALYAQGRTGPGAIVTNAKPGSSPHNFGMAIDICPVRKGQLWWSAPTSIWKQIADIGQECGLTAGFYFKSLHDAPHFEEPNWRATKLKWLEGKIQIT